MDIAKIRPDGLVTAYADNPLDDIELAENVYLSMIYGSKNILYIKYDLPYTQYGDGKGFDDRRRQGVDSQDNERSIYPIKKPCSW
jgi:hypothetical protein